MSAKTWSLAALALRVVLGAFFVYLGSKNLLGDEQMAADFRRFGYSDSFRRLVALAQIGGGALLAWPRTRAIGGALLAVVMLGALWSHFRHDPPSSLLVPAAFLGAIVAAALAQR